MQDADAERVRRLEAEVAELRSRLDRLEGSAAPTWRPVPGPAQDAPPPAAAHALTRDRPSLEERLGGNWLPKAGILVLVLGIVFFLKLAFDPGWIGLQARIVLGVVGGFALAGLGDLLLVRERFGRVYPQILTGGGAVIVYFSVFAAYAFEDYREAFGLALEADAILLGLVALMIALYALWRDTPTLAGEAGALIAATALFSEAWTSFAVGYLVVAMALLLAVGAYRRWHHTPLLLVLPAFLPLFVFLFEDVGPLVVALGGSGLFAAFVVAGLVRTTGDAVRLAQRVAQPAAALLTWILWMYYLQETNNEPLGGWVTLGGALLLLGLAFVPRHAAGASEGWGAAALVLALFWPPIEFDGTATVYGWAGLTVLAAAATFWRRTRWSDVGLLAAVLLMAGHLAVEEMPRLADDRLGFGPGLAVFGAATFAALLAWGIQRSREEDKMPITRTLLGVAVLPPILFFGSGLDGYGISIAWTVEAVLLVTLGLLVGIVDLRYAAFGVFGLVLVRVFLIDIQDLEPIYRVITFLVVGALLLVVSFFFARRKREQPPGDRPGPAHVQERQL